ncbi:acyl-CoA thioesterase [Luteibacter sp. SG786]|uniref:acyl-CoA thioesterase n=1 Tax=Luteibacter sp. SG786 TaxID=2587130 RepID=UPI001422F148|nr:acyl-CoA thioesterase [Luteibacter sp. SG786]NII54466.1 acyl-CoA thioester hydrolase [Luteibacter sp. SG786]
MRAKGVHATEIDVTVPFFDVDSMEVVWHGHYVKYLEVARCALLDELGHNYVRMKETGYAWPIIDLQLRYARPARFGQTLVVRAELVEWRNRLKIHYTLSDAATGERLTRASTIQVAVRLADGEMQLVSPAVFVDDVERHLASSLPRSTGPTP